MTQRITDILIVGGGDVGMLTGLCLQRLNPDLDIYIIDDFDHDPPEVGKSTYADITDIFHNFLGISKDRFVKEVKPIWKGSVYFRDWCGCERFHYPFDGAVEQPTKYTPNAGEHYQYLYEEVSGDPTQRTRNEVMAEDGKSPVFYDPNSGSYQTNQYIAYHLNTNRFNDFLGTICNERDITLINDAITSVEKTRNVIDRVRSEDHTYTADLFVDATGFNRILKRELDDAFREFEFPLDAALHAQYERPLSEVISATVVETGEYGWFWTIDTYEKRDRGYVYSSEYQDDDAAIKEFIEHCGGAFSESDIRKYEFSSGYYQTPWQENCVTIGNAVGFVEPLQSTALTVNAQAAVRLSNLLASHTRRNTNGARELYNSWVKNSWESIYDFIAIHYRYASGDNSFWEAVQSIPLSERVQRIIEEFEENGYARDFNEVETKLDIDNFVIFPPAGFHSLMRDMGATSSFYEDNDITIRPEVRSERAEYYEQMKEDAEDFFTVEQFYKGILSSMDSFAR